MKKLPPVVLVTWHDAHDTQDDFTPEQLRANHKPAVQRIVGFQMLRDRKGISLAADIDEAGDGRSVNFIPAAMIRSVRRLT